MQKKANKQWVWIAMDAKTRQIIAFHVGDRSHTSAEHLWAKIPQAYRHHATFYTDQYVVYEKVIPAAQHKAISKLARVTVRPRRVVLFQEARQPYRGHQALHLSLQSDERRSVEQALHGYHYPVGRSVSQNVTEITPMLALRVPGAAKLDGEGRSRLFCSRTHAPRANRVRLWRMGACASHDSRRRGKADGGRQTDSTNRHRQARPSTVRRAPRVRGFPR